MPKKRVRLRTKKSEQPRQRTEIIRRNSIKGVQVQDDLSSMLTELLGVVTQQLEESNKTLQKAYKVLTKANKQLAKSGSKDV